MCCVYQVPAPVSADFSQDFEDLVLQYLYNQWSISNPAKDPLGKTGVDGTKVQFRPGFPDYVKPFQVLCLQTSTRVADRNDPHSWHFFTQLEIRIIRAFEFQRDNVAVELGNMEREVERIINTYTTNAIPGISDIIYLSRQRDYGNLSRTTATAKRTSGGLGQGVVNSSASWATTTWESVTICELSYYKEVV